MRISELFISLQGEGAHAGIPMAFIRTQICPYRCAWCDTDYTWTKFGGTSMTIESIKDWLKTNASDVSWVCLTGGEPMLQPDVKDLLSLLHHTTTYQLEVETSGLVDITLFLVGDDAVPRYAVHSWVVDVKCPSSGESEKNRWSNLELLCKDDQVKFVVGTKEDLTYAEEVCEQRGILSHNSCPHILISPAHPSRDYRPELSPHEIAEHVYKHMPYARFSLQVHKVLEVK